jgi:hypothetical protein
MSVTLTIYDETLTGEKTPCLTLDFVKPHIKVRDLIRERIYQEVDRYNRSRPEYFRGLVQPQDSEQVFNGHKLPKQRLIDREQQYEKALQTFERNGFMVLVNDCEVEHLDADIELSNIPTVSFLRTYLKVGLEDERSPSRQTAKMVEPSINSGGSSTIASSLSYLFKGLSRPLRSKLWAGMMSYH